MIQGEVFYKYIKCDIDFDNAEQMIIVVYHELWTDKKLVFLKNSNPENPNAGKIEKSDKEDWDLMILLEKEMTINLPAGRYACELKQVISSKLILKGRSFFMNLERTYTE